MNIARSLFLLALPVLLIACAGSEDGGSAPETDAPDKQEAAAPETKMDPARDAAKTPEAPAEAGPTTSITFAENAHDFGTITDGDVVTHIFKFTNTGDEPLILNRCKGSCGCTVPQCDKDPIMPGATSSIKVKYDTKRVGPINKSVTITSNASNEPTKVIRIKGKIEAVAQTVGAPVKEAAGPTNKQ